MLIRGTAARTLLAGSMLLALVAVQRHGSAVDTGNSSLPPKLAPGAPVTFVQSYPSLRAQIVDTYSISTLGAAEVVSFERRLERSDGSLVATWSMDLCDFDQTLQVEHLTMAEAADATGPEIDIDLIIASAQMSGATGSTGQEMIDQLADNFTCTSIVNPVSAGACQTQVCVDFGSGCIIITKICCSMICTDVCTRWVVCGPDVTVTDCSTHAPCCDPTLLPGLIELDDLVE